MKTIQSIKFYCIFDQHMELLVLLHIVLFSLEAQTHTFINLNALFSGLTAVPHKSIPSLTVDQNAFLTSTLNLANTQLDLLAIDPLLSLFSVFSSELHVFNLENSTMNVSSLTIRLLSQQTMASVNLSSSLHLNHVSILTQTATVPILRTTGGTIHLNMIRVSNSGNSHYFPNLVECDNGGIISLSSSSFQHMLLGTEAPFFGSTSAEAVSIDACIFTNVSHNSNFLHDDITKHPNQIDISSNRFSLCSDVFYGGLLPHFGSPKEAFHFI